jgi:hypothetical protein
MSKVLVIGCGGVAFRGHPQVTARSARFLRSCASPAGPSPSAISWPPIWPVKNRHQDTTTAR